MVTKTNPDKSTDAIRALPLRDALFQEQVTYGIIVTDIKGIVRDWNPAAERIYGYTKDEALNSAVTMLHLPGKHPDLQAEIVEAIEREGRWSGRIEFLRKDGQEGTSDSVIFAFRDDDGQIGSISINHDITENIRAENALRESEERFRALVDHLPAGVTLKDHNHNVIFSNGRVEQWYGVGPEDYLGKKLHEKTVAPQGNSFVNAQTQVIDRREPVETEFWAKFADNSERYLHSIFFPVANGDSDNVVVGNVVFDITDRKKTETLLNQAHKMDAIGQLTGGIAHDFNNILMVTDGYTRRALDFADDPAVVREALKEVLIGTDRAALLTKQLLSFSRRQILEKRVFSAFGAIGDIETLLKKSLDETFELVIADDSENACVETDASELQQALLNLVINARDAMPQGGRIEITARLVEKNPGSAVARAKLTADQYVEISVRDEGIGIDENVAAHIFEPFFTTKDQGKGTGLGLAMVYGFATSSGGTVDMQTALGKGTTFSVYLPAIDREPQAIVAEIEHDHVGHGETILLVEDDPSLLEIVRDMLQSVGYNVLTASDGFEAIETQSEHDGEIDLLLSDVVMPNMGGFEAAEIIRAECPDIGIVFMSGYPNRAGISTEDIPDDCQILQKPVKPANLAKAIRQELDGSGTPNIPDETEDVIQKRA